MNDIFKCSIYNNEYIIGDMTSTLQNGFKSGVEKPAKLIIPLSIDGKEIKAIGTSAFRKCLTLKECLINARVHSIYQLAFFECQNLIKITFPSSLSLLEQSALDGRIDQTYAPGPLFIYFEKGSKLSNIMQAAISNFNVINVFLYDEIHPTNSTYLFGNVKSLSIYSRYSYKFCGFQTIASPIMFRECYTIKQKSNQFSSFLQLILFLLVSK